MTLKSIPNNGEGFIVATGRYLGEGFDESRLDTLFLHCLYRGKELLCGTQAACIVCMT